MLGVGKSDGNSQVHCCSVVTSSPRAVWVATILGISILYTVEIYLVVPFSRRRVVIANQDHICDVVITLLWQLHMITEVSRMWRKFGLSLSINVVIYFCSLSQGAFRFWAFYILHFGCLIHMGLQMVCKTHPCDCIIVLKSSVYH